MSGASDLRDFWQRLQTGVEVAVADSRPEVLLGVRDGFRRYFEATPGRPVPIAVIPHGDAAGGHPLLLSDESILTAARGGLERIRGEAGNVYHFFVGAEGGTHTLRIGGRNHVFVRCWTVLWSTVGEAVGSSGSVEIPQRFIDGLDEPGAVQHLPGTRRAGGLISSLTSGLETRRSAMAQATLHALASLFYGVVEGRPVRWKR